MVSMKYHEWVCINAPPHIEACFCFETKVIHNHSEASCDLSNLSHSRPPLWVWDHNFIPNSKQSDAGLILTCLWCSILYHYRENNKHLTHQVHRNGEDIIRLKMLFAPCWSAALGDGYLYYTVPILHAWWIKRMWIGHCPAKKTAHWESVLKRRQLQVCNRNVIMQLREQSGTKAWSMVSHLHFFGLWDKITFYWAS